MFLVSNGMRFANIVETALNQSSILFFGGEV
jgi:hypothetical protein